MEIYTAPLPAAAPVHGPYCRSVDTVRAPGYTLAGHIKPPSMSTLLEPLAGQLAGGRTARISQTLGANQDITQKAIGAALPLLLGALAKNSANREGADALHRAVVKDHDGSILGDLDGYMGRPSRVDDRMAVGAPEPEATFYTVVSGDSLSKIAKAQYGDPMKYPVIFEANQPMLKDPDKIYPGQVLRIPALK